MSLPVRAVGCEGRRPEPGSRSGHHRGLWLFWGGRFLSAIRPERAEGR